MNKRTIEEVQAEDAIRREFESTMEERVRRYVKLKPQDVIKYTHFAWASTECFGLYRDMHPYGCIALAQAVGEALVRFMCERNVCGASDDFEANVRTLSRRGLIPQQVSDWLLRLWEDRNVIVHGYDPLGGSIFHRIDPPCFSGY